MEILLSAIALALLLIAGSGWVWLLSGRERKIDALEFFGLSFLFGCTFISLSSFLLGLMISGRLLQAVTTSFSVGIFIAGFLQGRKKHIQIVRLAPQNFSDYFLLGVILAQFIFLSWFSLHTGLGWDGVFHWEIKARLAFENGGAMPLSYLTSKALWSSHRGYPLLLPLTEAWFYDWIGVAHQGMIKLLFPLFYLATLCLLASAEARRNWIAPTLMFFVPLAQFGDGSVSAGYADFPIAAFYLGSVIYLLRFWEKPANEYLKIFAALSISLPWIKQEGDVLFPIVAVLIVIRILFLPMSWKSKGTQIVMAMAPGMAVIIGWGLFVKIFKTPVEQYYLPPTLTTLMSNLHRTSIIWQWLKKEIFNWNHWGILWLIFPVAAILSYFSQQRRRAILLTLATIVPMAAYLGIYYFVATDRISIEEWLLTSLSRLMLHVAPIAVLLVGASISRTEPPDFIPSDSEVVP